MNNINKILVVLNDSEQARLASLYSIFLASLFKANLTGVYVVNEKALNDLLQARIFLAEEKVDYEKEMIMDAERYMADFENTAARKNIPVIKVIRKGVVHSEVIDLAKEMNAELIVIGGLKQILSLKDVTYDENERILREAKIPVLVVKNKEMIEMLYQNI